jgi:hypothetical protein
MAAMLVAYAVVAALANTAVVLPVLLLLGEGNRLRKLLGKFRRRR